MEFNHSKSGVISIKHSRDITNWMVGSVFNSSYIAGLINCQLVSWQGGVMCIHNYMEDLWLWLDSKGFVSNVSTESKEMPACTYASKTSIDNKPARPSLHSET